LARFSRAGLLRSRPLSEVLLPRDPVIAEAVRDPHATLSLHY
jgi:hypothetical protein